MSTPLKEQVQATSAWIKTLREEIARVIVGQEQLVERLLVGLLANGHVLLEGVPGLAKTLSVRTLAAAVQGELDRVSQTLTGRIRELAERYATPLPKLAEEVEALASRVDEHLRKMGAPR